MESASKSCFIIMPFGIKPVSNNEVSNMPPSSEQNKSIDFDEIYKHYIQASISELERADNIKIECIRSDQISKSGLIHKEMIDKILNSDLVIVDITTVNPNVFYELGIRHTIKQSGTIIVRQTDAYIPFNISGMKAVDYSFPSKPESPSSEEKAALDDSKKILQDYIKTSLKGIQIDSLVHTLFPGIKISLTEKPITDCHRHEFSNVSLKKKKIGFITGDIRRVENVDIWVNPENTNMEMNRIHDSSVSAVIRYYGSKRNNNGHILKDIIANDLEKRTGKKSSVEPGQIVITKPGKLKSTNKVKAIMHLAAMYGQPGEGYLPMRNHISAIQTILKEADNLNKRSLVRRITRRPLTSILIPLFGSRSQTQDSADVVTGFYHHAKAYFEQNPNSTLKNVYFLAWTYRDKQLCLAAVAKTGLEPYEDIQGPLSN